MSATRRAQQTFSIRMGSPVRSLTAGLTPEGAEGNVLSTVAFGPAPGTCRKIVAF